MRWPPSHLLLAVMLVAYPAGALAALGVRGAAGRGLVAGCALVGALGGLVLGAVCLGAGRGPTVHRALPSADRPRASHRRPERVLPHRHRRGRRRRRRVRLRLLGGVRGTLFPPDARRDAERPAAVPERAGDGRQRPDLSHGVGGHVAVGLPHGAHGARPAGDDPRRALVHRLHARRLRRPRGDVPPPVRGRADDAPSRRCDRRPWLPGSATRPSCWRCSASAPRPASSRCTCGCRWRIPSPRATCRR